MWRNCPGRRRQQTRQTTVSTDMDFMENFEPMNRWIDESLNCCSFSWYFWSFLRHTSGIHLDPRRYVPQELAIDTTLDYWTLLDTAGHWTWKSMEIDGNPETRNILRNYSATWGAVVSRACQWTVLIFISFLSLPAMLLPSLADFWVAHQYDRLDLAF